MEGFNINDQAFNDHKLSSWNNYRPKLITILWITFAYILIALMQFLTGYAIILQIECNLKSLDPMLYFIGSLLTGLLAGTIGGAGIVFLWEKWLRTQKYLNALFNIFLSYTLVYFMVAIPTTMFFISQEFGLRVTNAMLWKEVYLQQSQLSTLQNYFFWLFIVICTILVLQVNDKYGPGVLLDFLKGKYFQPQREERIFMFLDLRSSTSIAERLGEEKYFRFLNDVFKYTTPAILRTKGEIYQYVGDEIVISWKMKNGLPDANCLKCFFQVEKDLSDMTEYFQSQYGAIPYFKAGLHSGHVMAGEIGVVKRDIVFSGDVLNTTSRIQDMCTTLGVNILVSKSLMVKLKDKISKVPKKMGNILLRGKEEEIPLFTI